MFKTPCSHCRGQGFNPWSETIPHAARHDKIIIVEGQEAKIGTILSKSGHISP